MGRFLLALVAIAIVMTVVKIAVVALIIGGLIFRPKETIGLLLLGGLFALISKHPFIGIPLTIGLVALGITAKKAEAAASPGAETESEPDP